MSEARFDQRSGLNIGILRRGYSSSGGVEVYLKGLARGLIEEGHRPILIGTEDWPLSEWPGGAVIRTHASSPSGYAREVTTMLQQKKQAIDLTLSVEKVPGCDIYRTDEGVHAAWLEARSPHLSPLARLFQGISPKHREKLRLESELFTPQGVRRVIALSTSISGEIIRRYGYPEARIRMIRNGVSTPGSSRVGTRESCRESLGLKEGESMILFVGTGWERKGLRFATRAVEMLRDSSVRFFVAGEGDVRKFGSPATHFLGPVRDMGSLYAAADVLLFPTIYDPFPLSALEALSMGVPVITSAANGVSEVLTAGIHGEVVKDPSDARLLSRLLVKWIDLMKDPHQAESIRQACMKLAAEFSLERNLRETLEVIRELIREK